MRRAWVLCAAVALSGCPVGFETVVNAGRPFPCDPDAGEDPADGGRLLDGGRRQCANGWRCGLERVCHERGIEKPWLCADDSWCEGSWACRPDGVCAPFIADALRADAGEGAVRIARVSPVLLSSMPDTIAIAPDEQVGPSVVITGSGAAFTVGDQFTLLARSRQGPPGDPVTGNYLGYHFTAQLPTADIRALGASAVAAPQVLVLTAAGVGFVQVDLDAGPGSFPGQHVPLWPGVAGTELRIVSGERPYALAFGSGGGLTLLEYPTLLSDGGITLHAPIDARPLLSVDGRPPVLATKVTDFAHVNFSGRQVLVGNLDDRLWFAERFTVDGGAAFQDVTTTSMHVASDSGVPFWQEGRILPSGGGFQLLPYDRGYLFDGRAYVPGRVRTRGERVAIEVSSPGVAGSTLMLTQLEFVPFPPPNGELFPLAVLILSPCLACEPGATLVDFAPLAGTFPRMEARCNNSDGGFVTVLLFPSVGDAACSSEFVRNTNGPLGDFIKPQTALTGHGGWAGAHGQLWTGESLSDARPFVLDGPPEALVSAGDEVAATKQRVVFFLGRDAGFHATQGAPDDLFVPVASVAGNSDWLILRGGVLGRRPSGAFGNAGGAVLANPSPSVDPTLMRDPFNAGLGHLADGGAVVVFSSNDGVFSTDVSAFHQNPASTVTGTVDFRIVPLTRVAIRSLAVLDQATSGTVVDYVRAYALTGEELFEVVAADEAHWRAKPVPVPSGRAVAVWPDGEYGRLGYVSGKVISLPAQKVLADALPEAAQPVFDYHAFRGQPWAVARGGLFRLNAPPDPVTGPGVETRGTWVPGPDVGTGPDGGLIDFTGARFFETNGQLPDGGDRTALYLFTATGYVYQVR